DDTNGLNAPLTRHGAVPFGSDKAAITSSLWLETDRPAYEGGSPLGSVRQDPQTPAAKKTNDDDFSAEPKETYVEAPAKLEFDKAQWVERLKKCSAKALTPTGKATRGTGGVVFQVNTSYFVNSEGSVIQQSWTNAQL